MKKFNLIDIVTFVGIVSSIILILLFASGCAHKTPIDTRGCCQRLSLQTEEMSKFTRYCKVALFLSKSTVIDKKVKRAGADAVKVCKFVFNVESDQDLIAAGDAQEYYRVRSYIILDPDRQGFWRETLDCDPAEMSCEEFQYE